MEKIDHTCFLETRHKELNSGFYFVWGTNILVASNRSCNWTALFSFVYKKKKKNKMNQGSDKRWMTEKLEPLAPQLLAFHHCTLASGLTVSPL